MPLAIAAATLAVAVHFLERYFGPRAAIAGAALLVMPPPAVTQLSSIAVGFHPESTLLGVATLALLFIGEDPVRAHDWIARLPAEGRIAALEGADAAARWYRLWPGHS